MKLPQSPDRPLPLSPSDVKEINVPLWRIFKTSGAHPSTWNEMREFGPLPSMRFDPHPAGVPQDHPGVGVAYAGEDFYTAFAEVFSDAHTIDRNEDIRVLAAWEPTRTLSVLDLTAREVPSFFGAASIQMTDDKVTTQTWARALFEDHGLNVDGIRSRSSVDNGIVITLFSRAADSFPAAPREYQELRSSGADYYVDRASVQLKFGVI